MKYHPNSVAASLPVFSRRFAAVLLLSLAGTLCSGSLQAATEAKKAGAQLLKAQLPSGKNIEQTDCEILYRAVSRATVANRAEAPAILKAALTGNDNDDTPRKEALRPCDCVGRILRASVKAAPAQTSTLLDMAVALYPDCADALTASLEQTRGEIAIEAPVAGINNLGSNAAGGNADGGFGAGFGPGFPGSPGFGGSSPSGGATLPPPSGVAVTSVVNQ